MGEYSPRLGLQDLLWSEDKTLLFLFTRLVFLLFVFQAAQKNYFCQDNNSFGENEAKVFCGMLGWPTGTTLATVSSWYTEKTLNRIENTFIRTLPGWKLISGIQNTLTVSTLFDPHSWIKPHPLRNHHSRLSQNLMKCQFPWMGPSLGDLACFIGPKCQKQEILKISTPPKNQKN